MREHPRFPVSLVSTMELPDGRTIECLVLDLSLGGVGVETRSEVGDLGEFTLRVLEPGFELAVRCEARAIRDLWQKRVIHARFAGLDDGVAVRAAVERVSALASTASEGHGLRGGIRSTMRQLFRRRTA